MECTIKFDMDNAAFDNEPQRETSSLLIELASRVLNKGCQSGTTYPIRDSNGNKIGEAVFE